MWILSIVSSCGIQTVGVVYQDLSLQADIPNREDKRRFKMTDDVFVTRTAGIGCEGIEDQYADGKAARVWELLIGGEDQHLRTRNYKSFLVDLLRKKGCKKILDVACGTGVDSVMLLEEGFEVTSIDASDKMLKHAFKKRWERRKEAAFDKWVIEEANWLTLPEDLEEILGGGFDALVCLGNSFAHLVDISGDQTNQRKAMSNFERCIRPGGLLIIDHRNFDAMINFRKDATPVESIYYRNLDGLVPSLLFTNGRPVMLTLDYTVDVEKLTGEKKKQSRISAMTGPTAFRMSYYPYPLAEFTEMIGDAFPKASHNILGDFKPLDQIKNPGFYIHVLQKPKN